MFSALKKLVGSDVATLREKNIPAGLQSMNQTLQRRFAKGVQYNMKIVIRGDRNTGKTTLWHRLQGKKFVEEYIPTQEIQVTSIHWNYKTTDDIVKVEVWDVVDKGKGKKRGETTLKLENEPQEGDGDLALDAEFLDVYKNCNGVIMMFDITKQWTFTYITRELPKVPSHVPVCVLGNHRDMGEHRVTLPDDVRDFIQSLNRRPGSSYIRYAESSMQNSFGLKYLHKFFNIPFLQLQRETLLRQLETNQLDIDATLEELSVQQETEDQNYEIFLEMLENNKRLASPAATNGQSPSPGSQSPVVPVNSGSPDSSSPGTPLQMPSVLPASPAQAASPPPPESDTPEVPSPSPCTVSSPPLSQQPQQKRGFMSRLFGSNTPENPPAREIVASAEQPVKVQSVEDFVPEDSLDRSFLEDGSAHREQERATLRHRRQSDSDGDVPGTNPMVAGFQDDLDLDDRVAAKPTLAVIPSKNIVLSSDEEGPTPAVHIAGDEDVDTEIYTWKAPQPSAPQSGPDKQNPALLASQPGTKTKKGKAKIVEDSESDPEGPIATQMLSFVMDDPDFDSEDSNPVSKTQEVFPVLNNLSDSSSEETGSSQPPPTAKPILPTFKMREDADLFGLGFDDQVTKDGEEDKGNKITKEKTKKKKKSKEAPEEEKTTKKKNKHKKSKEKEEGKEGKEEKKKKPKKSKGKDEFDELEAFLGGGVPSRPRSGEEYEEL
ncbi:rab-like protein 6 isoform X2 [Pseudophryne corroboree]|uniref:rab-like protein 6 isoform X2 n=1 Tax=Pseudophryne corroboree TaxID=495146 RepID=UPI003081CA1F